MKARIMIAAIAAALAFTACKDEPTGEQIPAGEMVDIEIAIHDGPLNIATRGYLDDVAVTEDWEKEINNLTVYIYDESGSHVSNRSFSKADAAGGKVIMQIPREIAQTRCTFVVTANCCLIPYSTLDQAKNAICGVEPRGFHGEVDPMLSGCLSYNGFPMSGSTSQVMLEYGKMNKVSVELKRLMAKVALEFRIDPQFAANHNGGALRINWVYCGFCPDNCYVLESDIIRNTATSLNVWYQQEPRRQGELYQCLWYVYERTGQIFSGQPEELSFRLGATYDQDGDFSTEGDQSTVSYLFSVEQAEGNSDTKRNTCYRISAVIKGIGAYSLEVSYSVKDWVTPPISIVDVGI